MISLYSFNIFYWYKPARATTVYGFEFAQSYFRPTQIEDRFAKS